MRTLGAGSVLRFRVAGSLGVAGKVGGAVDLLAAAALAAGAALAALAALAGLTDWGDLTVLLAAGAALAALVFFATAVFSGKGLAAPATAVACGLAVVEAFLLVGIQCLSGYKNNSIALPSALSIVGCTDCANALQFRVFSGLK